MAATRHDLSKKWYIGFTGMYVMGSTKHVSLTDESYIETAATQHRMAEETVVESKNTSEQSPKVKYSLWDYYMQCTYTRYHIAYGRIKHSTAIVS